MRNLTLICCTIVLFGCGNAEQNKGSNKGPENILAAPPGMSKIDSAKMFIDSADYYVAKGVRGEMKNTEVNKMVEPLMEAFFRIYKELPPEDTAVVRKYRIEKVNKMIDLQMEQTNKK